MAAHPESLTRPWRIGSSRFGRRRRVDGTLRAIARTLAGGVSSGLRRIARPYPLFFDHGKGSRVWDVDGNQYIDYGLAWGPLILGHAPDCIVEALTRQAPRGLTFGASTTSSMRYRSF